MPAAPAATTVRRARPWLGTIVHIEAQVEPAEDAEQAVEAAFAAVAAIDRAMSFFRPDSDLARLHGAALGTPQAVAPATWQVLSHALELATASDGLFDPSIAGALVRHGLRALPAELSDLPPTDPQASWRDLELLPEQRVRLHRRLYLDLGGIAKGYAVDCAIAALQQTPGVHSGSVNAGGDLRHFGAAPSPLLLRHPADPGRLIPLGQLANAAAATSAGYFADSTARPMSPLIDPRSGQPQAQTGSVTVIADRCWLADGLTKIVALQGPAAGPLLARYAASAAIMSADGDIQAAPDFWPRLGTLSGHTNFPE